MTKNTKKFMRVVKRSLGKIVDLHMSACGQDGPLQVAFYREEELLEFIKAEVERLQKLAEKEDGECLSNRL